MVLFPKDTVEIYEELRNGDECGYDDYNTPLKCLVLQETVKGDLQADSPNNQQTEHGTIDQSEFTLFLPVNSKITPSSKVAIEGYAGYFSVIGTPEVWNTLIPHVEVKLIKDR